MEVATAMFVERGYAATSLVDIAKNAGVATRTLYQHFGDKEAIFRDVVSARETGAVFQRPKIKGGTTLETSLLELAEYICEVTLREQSVGLMRLVVSESQRFPDFMKKLLDKTYKHFRANIAAAFVELADLGLAPDLDSRESAAIFHDLILGNSPLFTYAGWEASRPTRASLRTRVDFFIAGRFPGLKDAKFG